MTQTTAKLSRQGKHFEIVVDMDKALAFKKGKGGNDFLELEKIFKNAKEGSIVSKEDLEKTFATSEIQKIAETIIKAGEILVSQEHRDAEQEKRMNQLLDFLAKNAVDARTGMPITSERLKTAISQAKISIKNASIESQISEILSELSKILPIKVQTKRIKMVIPAVYTGQVYGIVSSYKESEDWKNDGSLEVTIKIPAGLIMDFYDKLNSITHGSVITQEIKEND